MHEIAGGRRHCYARRHRRVFGANGQWPSLSLARRAPQLRLLEVVRRRRLDGLGLGYYIDYDCYCRLSGPRAYGASSSACPLGCIAISSGVR